MSAEAPRCPVCGTDLQRAREIDALTRLVAAAEHDYAKAADRVEEAGANLRRLYRELKRARSGA